MTDHTPSLSADEWGQIHLALSAPFPEGTVKSFRGRGSQTFSYIDARDVMNRLDEVVGAGNWSDSYVVVATEPFCVIATLTVHGVSHSDIGYSNNPDALARVADLEQQIEETDPNDAKALRDLREALKRATAAVEAEPGKAAASDGLKRAAVKFGIGRFLYDKKPGSHTGTTQHSDQATPSQLQWAQRLLREQGLTPEPTMSRSRASAVIAKYKDAPPSARADRDAPPGTHEVVTPATPAASRSAPAPAQPSSNGQDKPASENQKHTIIKLANLLDKGAPDDLDTLTADDASARIAALSSEYNQRTAASKRAP